MPISLTCANGHPLRIEDEYAGKTVQCPKCQDIVEVPAANSNEAIIASRAEPSPELLSTSWQGKASAETKPAFPRRSRGWKLPVFLGGGVAAVALIAVLSYFLYFKPLQKARKLARDREAVETVAKQMAEAMKNNDRDAFLALLTEKGRQEMTKAKDTENDPFKSQPGATYRIGDATIDGDTAEVPIFLQEAGEEAKGTLKLRREGDQWRVWALGARSKGFLEGIELTFNYEDPEAFARQLAELFMGAFKNGFGDMFSGKAGPADKVINELQGMSLDEFNRTWQESLDVKDQPAGEVLQKLADKYRIKLEKTALNDKALAKPITVQLEGRSRWELIEEVCRQAGLYPVYQEIYRNDPGKAPTSETKMSLKQRPRPWPVAFVGPFLVEIEELTEFTPYATGIAQVKVSTSGLHPIIVLALEKDFDAVQVTQIVDAEGRDLRDAEANAMTGGFALRPGGQHYEKTLTVPLKNLLRDLAVIKTIQGRVRFTVPVKVESVRFDKLTANTTQKIGKAEITLRQVQEQEMTVNNKKQPFYEYRFDFKGIGYDKLKFVAHDANGELLGLAGAGGGDFGDQGTASVTCYQQPASITVKVLTETQPVEYDFRLEDVPLRADPMKPEKLSPAQFPGHETPVTLEFTKVVTKDSFAKILVRAVNHSDKDIRLVETKLDYFDASGKKLHDWPSATHRPTPKFPVKEAPVLVAKKSTTTFEMDAPFLPAETTKVDLTLLRVGFADATEWRPAAPR